MPAFHAPGGCCAARSEVTTDVHCEYCWALMAEKYVSSTLRTSSARGCDCASGVIPTTSGSVGWRPVADWGTVTGAEASPAGWSGRR